VVVDIVMPREGPFWCKRNGRLYSGIRYASIILLLSLNSAICPGGWLKTAFPHRFCTGPQNMLCYGAPCNDKLKENKKGKLEYTLWKKMLRRRYAEYMWYRALAVVLAGWCRRGAILLFKSAKRVAREGIRPMRMSGVQTMVTCERRAFQ
jgi:hypothetical protein